MLDLVFNFGGALIATIAGYRLFDNSSLT